MSKLLSRDLVTFHVVKKNLSAKNKGIVNLNTLATVTTWCHGSKFSLGN